MQKTSLIKLVKISQGQFILRVCRAQKRVRKIVNRLASAFESLGYGVYMRGRKRVSREKGNRAGIVALSHEPSFLGG